ncbi:MAG: hypothetical protein NW205_07715 [Hyphomicrobiaceae bacterium]|nr:hypothetical protein [Hyphomicrobiaceae bacterium]
MTSLLATMILAVMMVAIPIAAVHRHLVVNLTASMPRGLYLLSQDRSPREHDIVARTGPCRSVIPIDPDQAFQGRPIKRSDRSRSAVPGDPDQRRHGCGERGRA